MNTDRNRKPARRHGRRRQSVLPPEEVLYCSMRVCQDQQPRVKATNTIVLHDAKTGEQVIRHRCDEHTHPMHTVIAREEP